MKTENKLVIFCDGGSRGNPGQAAYGFVVKNAKEEILYQEGNRLGIQTNNYAEYTAVIKALHWVLKNTEIEISKIDFFLDSSLIVNQMNGLFRVKTESIRELYVEVKNLLRQCVVPVSFTHVPREKNKQADSMVNMALDA